MLAAHGCTLVLKLSDSIKMRIRHPRDVRETRAQVAGTGLVVIVLLQSEGSQFLFCIAQAVPPW